MIFYEVFFLNNFSQNTLLGTFSMTISSLYENINHEIYNTWLTLTT